MASARKKQDEKNLKILRELVSLPHNKYCFDCNQRGPTYVNVTIGSFVCTKCSGMLRGLTPPHRVKSISMATFTSEEIDYIRSRGNDYCRRTYLGLYEGAMPSETRDEQQIHDLMVDKYERRRYYMEPSLSALKNGHTQQQNMINSTKVPDTKPLTTLISDVKPVRVNGTALNENRMPTTKHVEFVADFASADIFNATNNNSAQPSFANFDNNPIFNNSNSMPLTNNQNGFQQLQNNNVNGMKNGPPAPSEDRYAALKDLDNALKAQPPLDWNSGSSNSLYSSSTPAGSLYSSPSPQGSMYGSPSQSSQFTTMFPQEPTTVSNPFNNGSLWNGNGSSQPPMTNGNQSANPFRAPDPFKVDPFKTDQFRADPFKADPFKADPFKADPFKVDPFKLNGVNQGFQTMGFPQPINGTSWTPNPFKLGATSNGHSNNPFL